MSTRDCRRIFKLFAGFLLAAAWLPCHAASGLAQAGPPIAGSEPVNTMVDAQAKYREGRELQERGKTDQARRKLQEAAQLDPGFADPQFALAGTYLPFRPDLAVSSASAGIKAQVRTFRGQHRLVMNVALLLLAIAGGALLAASALIGLKALHHFQHPIAEFLGKRLPPGPAAVAAWVIVLQPALWGMGLFLTMALALGLLWLYLNRGEKRVAVGFLGLSLLVPLAFHGLSRIAAPLDPESNAYLLSVASDSHDQPGLTEALARVSAANPGDPSPHMAMGLVAEHKSDWATAESEYRRALELEGSAARLHNNLGNVLAQTGRLDEAVAEYQKSIDSDPRLAAPHFNLGQAYARRLQFDLVDQEMAKATDLDFDGMRSAITQSVNGQKALISMGLSAGELWQATFDSPAGFEIGLPRRLSWIFDAPLRRMPALAVCLFGIGWFLGRRIYRFLPTYACAHCGTVVCRKCLRRIRKRAYCVTCGNTILSLKSSEFTRMLLERRLDEERNWFKRLFRFFLVMLIPGWEAIRRGRPMVGLGLQMVFMGLMAPQVMKGWPVKSTPSLPEVPGNGLWLFLAFGLLVLYGASALILRALPEPESSLMRSEIGMVPDRSESMDRAA